MTSLYQFVLIKRYMYYFLQAEDGIRVSFRPYSRHPVDAHTSGAAASQKVLPLNLEVDQGAVEAVGKPHIPAGCTADTPSEGL